MKKIIWALSVLFVPLLVMAAPDTIRFQGRLTDNSGIPIVGSSVTVQFLIYNSLTGGTALWQTPSGWQQVSSNSAGLFSTDIGPIPTSLFANNNDLYMEIKLQTTGPQQTLTPRQKLSSVPFSIHSEYAVNAGTATTVADDSITSDKIADDAVDSGHIIDGSVTGLDLSTPTQSSLIPPGMIAMFAQGCPNGWTRFSQLDNAFPMGVASYTGVLGGSSTITGQTLQDGIHNHNISTHTHNISHKHVTPLAGTIPNQGAVFGAAHNSDEWGEGYEDIYLGLRGPNAVGPVSFSTFRHYKTKNSDTLNSGPSNSATTAVDGAHIHNFNVAGWSPPYLGVVFCEKN